MAASIRSGSGVAILFEPGRTGTAALEEASAFAAASGSELTVVVTAPQAPQPRCCGASPDAYNCVVRDEAASELRDAAHLLNDTEQSARFTLLVEGRDPPLRAWVAEHGFELVLLPARRRLLRSPGHPALRSLRRVMGAGVRVVASPTRAAAR
jgi:hypothetical protein